MNRKLLTLIGSAVVLVAAFGMGGIAGAIARTDTSVLHVVVTTQDSRGALVHSEYWVDDARGLAKVSERTPNGLAVHTTGSDWALDIPAAGDRAYLYRVQRPGTGPTQSIRGRLFYYRDSYKAGTAPLVAQDGDTLTVRAEDGSLAAFDAVSGLPIWALRNGVRTTYQHTAPETLPATAFPTAFFTDAPGRRIAHRTETTLADATARATFPFRSPGTSLAGQPLTFVLVSDGDSERTLQQINLRYGGDIEIVQSLLATSTTLGRPGGSSISGPLGSGAIFQDIGSVSAVLIKDRVATTVIAPTEEIARAIVSQLGTAA